MWSFSSNIIKVSASTDDTPYVCSQLGKLFYIRVFENFALACAWLLAVVRARIPISFRVVLLDEQLRKRIVIFVYERNTSAF